MKESHAKAFFLVAMGLALCSLLVAAIAIGSTYRRPQTTPQPQAVAQARLNVLFASPQAGAQVTVGQPLMVHIVASGDNKITRVELWIDGQLHAAQNSTLPDGASPFPLVVYWQPATAGTHALIARAFDGQGGRAQATIDVEATAANDRDGDGVADEVDACPDEAGRQSTGGCADGDGDGVADAQDACAAAAGAGADGCPAPAADDRDGDGIADEGDACPDEPGLAGSGCPLVGDRDGDGVADDEDACPDVTGSPGTAGCPDRDGDGIPDAGDACPDAPGPFEGGCPAPSSGDRDGDGFADGEDMCPDEPGTPETWGCPDRDRDGVRDSEDGCPDEWGPPENRGCPVPDVGPGGGPGGGGDSDSDGIPDGLDPCPLEPGPPEHDGCPDSDGDGIPDWWDRCPDEPGTPEAVGCPGSGVGDRDGDGAPDDVDLCPDESGRPEDGGCPAPTDDEEEMAPGPGEVEWPDGIPLVVEFQALSFGVSHDYDGVYCYPRLAGGAVERYSFEPLGAQQWDIATPLGSRLLLTRLDQPIVVQAECGGDVIFMGDGGGWGTYWSMGAIDMSHPSSDWDGHVITVRSTGGDEGRWFEAQYRLCSGSCDETAFPPPLVLLSHGRDNLLIWQWDGDMSRLASYGVYVDGSRVMRMRGTSNVASMDVGSYAPLCGGRREFTVTAYGADGRESPHSNVVTWEAPPCPRVVRVTFDRLWTLDSGDQENDCVGPIFGSFWVQGSESRYLSFEGADGLDGFRLCPHRRYDIQEMFDTIWRWGSGMGRSPYRAPESNSVTVELGPDEDLTLGGAIYEWDRSGAGYVYREVYMRSLTRSADDLRPGRYALVSGQVRLEFMIDVLVGPEAGREPDLTITNVDRHEPSGQLRVHVFNNAADMAAPADITVHWTRVGSSEIVGMHTWRDVQIPSGGSRILQLMDAVDEIGGMVFVLDPDGALPDGNRGNNSFETPVTMRVEFLEVRGAHCSESGCSIFDCDSEWEFRFWAGYGPTASDISWIVHNVRYPSSGDLVACSHSACMGHASSDADWVMEGDGRYAFEFDVPATQNLYVMVTATELDVWTSDDPFASPVYPYSQRDNWGASTDAYTGFLEATSDCNDALCGKCIVGVGVWARWRITRIE